MQANLAESADINVYSDPVTALFKLRQFGEKYVRILFDEHGIGRKTITYLL